MSEFDPPVDRSPSDRSRAARQIHAVLAWLVVETDVPVVAHRHLVDALVAWSPVMGEQLFPTEPEAGADADLHQVLNELWWRLDALAAEARWADKVVLNEVRGRVGLAMHAVRARHARPRKLPRPRSPGP